MAFQLKTNLHAGDVIFVTDQTLPAKLIRRFSWLSAVFLRRQDVSSARWSHVLIVATPFLLLEAVPGRAKTAVIAVILGRPTGQVQQVDIRKFAVERRSDISIRRLDARFEDIPQNAAAQAMRMKAQRYNARGIAGFILPWLRKEQFGRQFCSELVLNAYRNAGLDLVPGRSAVSVTPSELSSSSYLKIDITDSCIIIAETGANNMQKRSPGFTEQQRIIAAQAVAENSQVQRRWEILNIASPFPTDPIEAVAHTRDRELDQAVATILQEHRYHLAADDLLISTPNLVSIVSEVLDLLSDNVDLAKLDKKQKSIEEHIAANQLAADAARQRIESLDIILSQSVLETIALDRKRWSGLLELQMQIIREGKTALKLLSKSKPTSL